MPGKLACATSCFGAEIHLPDTLRAIAAARLRCVEIMAIPNWFEHVAPERMNAEDESALRNLLERLELTPLAVSGHCELGRPGEAVLLEERIRFAARLGVPYVVTGSGTIRNRAEEHRFFDALRRAAAAGERYGVGIALETGGEYLPNGAQLAEMLRAHQDMFGDALVGIAYDPANVLTFSDSDPLEDIRHALPYLLHVHLKDRKPGTEHYPPIGEGNVDFNRLFDILHAFGYRGGFAIEVDCLDPAAAAARANLEKSLAYLYNKTNFPRLFAEME